jgi:hypothetical protein
MIRSHAGARHQQPTTTALLQRMMMRASGGLSDLIEKRLRVSKHDRHYGRIFPQDFPELTSLHAQACAWYLHLDVGRGLLVAEYHRKADNPLVAHGSHLGSIAIPHQADQ